MIVKKSSKGFASLITLVGLVSCAIPVLASTPLMKQDDLLKTWKQGGLTAVKSGSTITLTSPKKTPRLWSVQAGFNPKVALRKGDILQLKFSIRSVKPTTGGQVSFGVQGGKKYESQGGGNLKLTGKMQNINLSIPVKGNYPAGQWQVTFGLGALAQTMQISNLSLVKK